MSTLGASVVDPHKHLRCLDGGFSLSTMFVKVMALRESVG